MCWWCYLSLTLFFLFLLPLFSLSLSLSLSLFFLSFFLSLVHPSSANDPKKENHEIMIAGVGSAQFHCHHQSESLETPRPWSLVLGFDFVAVISSLVLGFIFIYISVWFCRWLMNGFCWWLTSSVDGFYFYFDEWVLILSMVDKWVLLMVAGFMVVDRFVVVDGG